MVSHVILLKPRQDLSPTSKNRLIDAFERATREIPTVRNVRVARRVTHGAGYENQMPDSVDYMVSIEFDNVDGLTAYLRHPAHAELGTRFAEALSAALIYDLEEVSLESLRDQ
jgi:Stress responsive A/B Barrel Domain